jgi:hypothetical protein
VALSPARERRNPLVSPSTPTWRSGRRCLGSIRDRRRSPRVPTDGRSALANRRGASRLWHSARVLEPRFERCQPGRLRNRPLLARSFRRVIVVAEVPADPAIPHPTFPSRGREAHLCHPMTAVGRHLPDRFADLGQGDQVMLRLHQALVGAFFASLHGANPDLFEAQDGLLGRRTTAALSISSGAECPGSAICP